MIKLSSVEIEKLNTLLDDLDDFAMVHMLSEGLWKQGKQYEQLLLTIVRVWGGWMHVNEYFKTYLEDNGVRIQFFSIMSDNEDPTSESTITFEE